MIKYLKKLKNKKAYYIIIAIIIAFLILIISIASKKDTEVVEPQIVEQTEEVVEEVKHEYSEEELKEVINSIEQTGDVPADAESVTLAGSVPEGISIKADGEEVKISQDQKINHEVKIEPKQEEVEVAASDEVGNEVKDVIKIEREKEQVVKKDTCVVLGAFSDQFLCLINTHRVANGKGKLTYSGALNTSATKHTKWMVDNDDLSHSEGDGSTAGGRCIKQGTICSAENVAWGFNNATHLFNLWKDSPLHNKNMLGNYTLLGLGVNGLYATALFQ